MKLLKKIPCLILFCFIFATNLQAAQNSAYPINMLAPKLNIDLQNIKNINESPYLFEKYYKLEIQQPFYIDSNSRIRYLEKTEKKLFFLSPKNDKNFDLIEVLLDSLFEKLGYTPLVAVIGSSTYKLNEKAEIDWNNIDDIDIIVYLPNNNDVICQREDELLEFLYSRLSKKGVEDRHIVTDNDGITRKHEVVIKFSMLRELMKNPDDPFRGSYDKFRLTDYFFGNIELLNSILSQYSLKYILKNVTTQYRLLWQEINITPDKLDASLLRKRLNRMRLLAFMRGKDEEFNSIIDTINIEQIGWKQQYLNIVTKLAAPSNDILKAEFTQRFISPKHELPITLSIEIPQTKKLTPLSNHVYISPQSSL